MEEKDNRIEILDRLSKPLLLWFSKNRRELPFRKDRDPYKIYVSEIMLQQTRISAVIPYYLRFIEKSPDLRSLADADTEELMKLWEGLGYYSRARNLKRTAEICRDLYGGFLPSGYDEILALPGIGSYTAGAILSLARDEKVPLLDGNVQRVLSRVFADDRDIGDPKVKKESEALLKAFLESASVSPGSFNEALMELGETLCIPNGTPDCKACPIAEDCMAMRLGKTSELPKKAPKKKRKVTTLTVFLLYSGGKIGLQRREEGGLLAGLYGFPTAEGALTEEEVREKLSEEGLEANSIDALAGASHVFTHVEWDLRAYRIVLKRYASVFSGSDLLFVTEKELDEKYALPGAFRKWTLFPNSEEP